ncbi:MAG: EAL domain-containing protein [Sulfurimonas sp.]|nr:EAL domain-containing protein [Sulfurimonas sp.]
MHSYFNNKILKIIPIIFLIVLISKLMYTYNDSNKRESEFAKQEARILYDYVSANRGYHRALFTNGSLTLNSNTIQILPSFSSNKISKEFSEKNSLNITIKTVSDNARNSVNTADDDELKAIKYFKKNKEAKEYFENKDNKYYQYAHVLKVDKACLECHGKKEDAPQIIQNNYNNAYNYKIGEVRGIVSVKIPTVNLKKYFLEIFIYSIIYDTVIFIFLFLGIYYLLDKSKKMNTILEFKVKKKTQELKNSLLHERLTHLPNRLKLIEDIALNSNSESSHLALINIDNFKDINDLYGFKVGDEILKQIAQTIKNLCKDSSFIYKLPNDEYAIFTTIKISQKEFLQKVQHIIHVIQESKFEANDNIVLITLSCGVASNEEALIIKANAALQIAKDNRKGIVIYDNSLDTKEQISLNNDALLMLKEAIKEDKITPFFQPIYNTRSKKIEKYESLARIILKDGKVIPPFDFLDIAIKSKLYPEITKAMIRKSFEYFKDKDYEFSINISINDIQNRKTLQFILDSVIDFPNSKNIVFEILESDKVENYEKLNKFIKEMKRYGCKIAIDDFGSGYSNFSHILELNTDYLKIDSSLVRLVTKDENSRVIVKTIINFASNLGMKTIAEFVEDKKSLDLLEKMGVDFIQGYYIGKPSPELNSDFES